MKTIIICNFKNHLPSFLLLSCLIHAGFWGLSPQDSSRLELDSRFIQLLEEEQKVVEIQVDRWVSALAVAHKKPVKTTPTPPKVEKVVQKKKAKKKRKKRRVKRRVSKKKRLAKKQPKKRLQKKQNLIKPQVSPEAPSQAVASASKPSHPKSEQIHTSRNEQITTKVTKTRVTANGPEFPPSLSRTERRQLERAYYGTLNRFLKKEKNYPRSARRLQLEGTVWIELMVNHEGKILKVDVLRSSGHDVLDKDALAWVQNMKKLPSPPNHLKWKQRAVRIPFNYRLQS